MQSNITLRMEKLQLKFMYQNKKRMMILSILLQE